MSVRTNEDEKIREQVRHGYGKIALEGSCCAPATGSDKGGCCGSSPEQASALIERIGYSTDEIAALPEGANMGLSCGNPTAIASLKPGEIVLDLGSGGGFDVFIAAQKVAPHGRAIGVDMTTEMLAKARRNVDAYEKRTGLRNVEFRLGEIEHLPIADNSVDVVISNCVINLSPDKAKVWREISRVLKPGGRVAISDLALFKPLPDSVRDLVEALVGCIAGAVLVEDTEQMMRQARLVDIILTPRPEYVEAMSQWNDPLYAEVLRHLPPNSKPADFITSLSISARNPCV